MMRTKTHAFCVHNEEKKNSINYCISQKKAVPLQRIVKLNISFYEKENFTCRVYRTIDSCERL